jgi:hypothetical protein
MLVQFGEEYLRYANQAPLSCRQRDKMPDGTPRDDVTESQFVRVRDAPPRVADYQAITVP